MKYFGGLAPESEAGAFADKRFRTKLTFLNDVELKDKQFIVGNKFTIADSYLYIVLTWVKPEDLDNFPTIKAYFNGIKALDGVVNAHARIATNPASIL